MILLFLKAGPWLLRTKLIGTEQQSGRAGPGWRTTQSMIL